MTNLIVKCNKQNIKTIIAKIATFYMNAKIYKYKHAYGWDDVLRDINKAQSDTDYVFANATTDDWQRRGYVPIRNKFGWAFGCEKIKENNVDVFYIRDAENCKNLTISLQPPKQQSSTKKDYRILRTKPLFGFRFVMHNKTKEYNLIDNDGKLLTQWFKNIKRPFQTPYGKNKVIAYINIGGIAHSLHLDGTTQDLNRTWLNFAGECCSQNDNYTDLLLELYYSNWYSMLYS